MLHGCLHHEKERENVCPKCPLKLLFGNSFNRILWMLFGRVVYNDVDSAKFLYGLGKRRPLDASDTSISAPPLPCARCFLGGGRTRTCRALFRHPLCVSRQCLP